jgi:hypothetical protein
LIARRAAILGPIKVRWRHLAAGQPIARAINVRRQTISIRRRPIVVPVTIIVAPLQTVWGATEVSLVSPSGRWT